jgi:hypothetical protein
MKNDETILVDCGHGAIRIKAWMTVSGISYQFQAFKPSWNYDGVTEPPESCLMTINGAQARQIVDALNGSPSEHEKALRELVKQITIGTFVDSEGHSAKLLFAYAKAKESLGSS